MDNIVEVSERPVETDRFNLPVVDKRNHPDIGQQFSLVERIKKDKVDVDLSKASLFLGEYAKNSPNDLSVAIVDGRFGEGTINDKVIEVQLSPMTDDISEIKTYLESIVPNSSEEEKNGLATEIIFASTASTVLHEGVHGLLDSKPKSKFHLDLEKLSGIEDPQAKRSTLVDEGIAYAIQGLYSPEIHPTVSLIPSPKQGENPKVAFRKVLGGRLRQKIKEYIDNQKPMDDDFLRYANEQLEKI